MLRQVRLPIVNRTTCGTDYPGQITDVMFCAGPREGGKDTCQVNCVLYLNSIILSSFLLRFTTVKSSDKTGMCIVIK